MELSKKVAVDADAPVLEAPKKLSTSGDSSDPDVVTRDLLCKDTVPHFSLDLAGKDVPYGEAASSNHVGDREDERRTDTQSELDLDYKDACDSSDVLRQTTLPVNLSSPLHETASPSFTTSDSGSASELVMDTSSSKEEKLETSVHPFAMQSPSVALTAEKSTGRIWKECIHS